MTNARSLLLTLNSPCFTSSVPVFVPVFLSVCLSVFLSVFAFSKISKYECDMSGEDLLTVNVSDQVCEAEKDEDGHALNLKGENYFHLN